MTFRQDHFGNRTHRHQPTGTREVQTLTPKLGISSSLRFSRCRDLPGLAYRYLSTRDVNRTGENHGRDCQNSTVQQVLPISALKMVAIAVGPGCGGGSRGSQTVQPPLVHQHKAVDIRGSRDGKHQRQHQHEAHFKNRAKPTVKPVNTTAHWMCFYQIWQSAWWRYVVRHRSLPAFAQHCAKTHDQGKATERPAAPALMEPITLSSGIPCINPTQAPRGRER